MAIAYTGLLGTSFWHTGNGTITYSILSQVPAYYPRRDSDNNGSLDVYDTYHNDPTDYLPVTATLLAMNGDFVRGAVQGWNDVANTRMVLGTVSGTGPGTGAPVAGNGTLVTGLGGPTGFGEIEIPRNDDGSSSQSLASVFTGGLNFFGTNYTSMFVNTNGSISFANGISTYTPTTITGGTTPIIAPFWADVDTRAGAPIYVDMDTTNKIVTVTWAGVGYYSQHTSPSNSFQLQLYDRGGGNFDMVFRYQGINWTTGDASGGTNGLGGTPARAGWSDGKGNFFELPQSGNQASLLNLENVAGNTNVTGMWVWRAGGAVGDITWGNYNFTDTAYGWVSGDPATLGTPSLGGDVWINNANAEQAAAAFGNTGYQTYLHELGHALGLTHPGGSDGNNPATDNQWTVMSYNAHANQSGITAANQVWPITPMILDIQAIQSQYGANRSTRAANTTYFGPAVAGSTETAYQISDHGRMSNTRPIMMTIWDGAGVDTVNCANQTDRVLIDLRPGAFSSIGTNINGSLLLNNIGMSMAVTVAGVVVNYIENAVGGGGNDTLTGNPVANALTGGAGNDSLFGMAGDDTLRGDAGVDAFDGGAGTDTVTYAGAAAGLTANLQLGIGAGEALNETYLDVENVIGTDHNDVLVGKAGVANALTGGIGADTFYGEGIDTFNGGAGLDTLFGSLGAALNVNLATTQVETAWGGFLADILNGSTATFAVTLVGQGPTADTLRGGSGNDFIYYRRGDTIHGGAGFDWAVATLSGSGVNINLLPTGFENAWGSAFADTLNASTAAGQVVLVGDAGNDTLIGGTSGDFLYGFGDADTLAGGLGNDNLIAGAGNDAFLFGANWGRDIVWDWVNNVEKFNLNGSGATSFAQLTVNQNLSGSGNALISFGANQILVVGGANLIDATDFLFV